MASTAPRTSPRCWPGWSRAIDMVVGARDRSGQANLHRGLANGFYNRLASWMTGHKVVDLTSGFRAVRADKFREFLHLLPNGFSYPTTCTMAFFRSAYPVAYVPIPVAKRVGTASHIRPLQGRRPLPADHLQDRQPVLAAEVVRAGSDGICPTRTRVVRLDVRSRRALHQHERLVDQRICDRVLDRIDLRADNELDLRSQALAPIPTFPCRQGREQVRYENALAPSPTNPALRFAPVPIVRKGSPTIRQE
jgi:hypothetical protein